MDDADDSDSSAHATHEQTDPDRTRTDPTAAKSNRRTKEKLRVFGTNFAANLGPWMDTSEVPRAWGGTSKANSFDRLLDGKAGDDDGGDDDDDDDDDGGGGGFEDCET